MEDYKLKTSSNVRRPSLVDVASKKSINEESMSIGEVLRKAKKDLFFSRCLLVIFLVLLATGVVLLFVNGYAETWFDTLISMME